MNLLIVGVNWLGDCCMTMPALQAFRQRHPQVQITMLSKPPIAPLWNTHPAVDQTVSLAPGITGLLRTAIRLRRAAFDTAYVFPNSWRSALVPFLAGIPRRIGLCGHHRHLLLSRTVTLSPRAVTGHQQWEYVDILQLDDLDVLPAPTIHITAAASRLPPAPAGIRTLGIIPGAARGPSKQWPPAHFIETARQLRNTLPCRFALLGTAADTGVCDRLAQALATDAIPLAGKTTLAELAASLAACDAVLCNDSGGMHLAATVGTPVIAIFGLTDPAKTGPLGDMHTCIRAADVKVSRQIARQDATATRALAGITPEQVTAAVLHTLTDNRRKPRPRSTGDA